MEQAINRIRISSGVRAQVGNKCGALVANQARDQVWQHVFWQISNLMWDQVWWQVRGELR